MFLSRKRPCKDINYSAFTTFSRLFFNPEAYKSHFRTSGYASSASRGRYTAFRRPGEKKIRPESRVSEKLY